MQWVSGKEKKSVYIKKCKKESITPTQKQRKLVYHEADAQVLCATAHVMAQLYSSSHALLL